MTSDAPKKQKPIELIDTDRLKGWKEIASFLGCGVRTAQRWELNYGLPVRRIGRDGGEIVFASRIEISAWMEAEGRRRVVEESQRSATPAGSNEGPSSTGGHATSPKSPHAKRWLPLLVVGGCLALAAWLGLGNRSEDAPGRIFKITNEFGDLVAHDANGRILWRYNTGLDLQGIAKKWAPGESNADYVVIDLDSDGHQEVIVAGRSASRGDGMAFLLLTTEGTLKQAIRPNSTVGVGPTTFGGPWVPHSVFVILSENRTARVFLSFIDPRRFPTLLLEVSPQGEVLSEYFSNGYINSVVELPWAGQKVLAIGAANNEHRGGSLAVFTNRPASGSAPAANGDYRCLTCVGGHPDAFLVFPARCFNQALDRASLVQSIQVDAPDQLAVQVLEGDGESLMGVMYVLGPDLRPVRAEATTGLVEWHARWFKEGRLDHPLSAERDGKDFFPVLAWLDGRFDRLPPGAIVW